MRTKIRLLLGVMSVLIASGCAHTVDLSKFKESSLDQRVSDVLPPQHVIDKKQPKAAVLPFGEPDNFVGSLSQEAQEGVTQILAKGCGMEVVERSQIQKFMEEKKFSSAFDPNADLSGLQKMAGGIDYLILGSITNAATGAEFSPRRTTYDQKGRSYTTDPGCSVRGQSTVNIRVVNASDGTIAQAFPPFNGKSSSYFTVAYSGQCNVGNPVAMVNQAIQDAMKTAKKSFLESFPRYGYLYKTMTNAEGKRIAYVNLGKLDGIKAGDDVELVRYVKETDRIRKIERLTLQKICEVKIAETDLLDDRSIIIIPEEYSSHVMPGLAVKTKYNSSFFSNIF